MDAVINITELCEQIVLRISGKDIINCMRVSRAFKTMIAGSLKVKRKLFLAAEPDSHVLWHIDCKTGDVNVATFATMFNLNMGPGVSIRKPVRYNKLVLRRGDHGSGPPMEVAPETIDPIYHPSDVKFAANTGPDIYGAFFTSLDTTAAPTNASCLNMYISQPPVQKAKLVLRFAERSQETGLRATMFPRSNAMFARQGYYEETIQNGSGVTFGEIINAWRNALKMYNYDGLVMVQAYIEIEGVVWATERQVKGIEGVEVIGDDEKWTKNERRMKLWLNGIGDLKCGP